MRFPLDHGISWDPCFFLPVFDLLAGEVSAAVPRNLQTSPPLLCGGGKATVNCNQRVVSRKKGGKAAPSKLWRVFLQIRTRAITGHHAPPPPPFPAAAAYPTTTYYYILLHTTTYYYILLLLLLLLLLLQSTTIRSQYWTTTLLSCSKWFLNVAIPDLWVWGWGFF